jgi:hypothetical protein
MEQPHVIQQQHLLLIVTPVSPIWHVVLQAQLELVLVIHHGRGIRHLKHANARILCIICREHLVVRIKNKIKFS